jgi:hypothetical protein
LGWPGVRLIRVAYDALMGAGVDVASSQPRRLDACQPQAISAFPLLQRLVRGDAWFDDPAARAQRIWEREGWAGHRYAFFIVRKGETEPSAGLLVRGAELEYCRLYPAYALAAIDAVFWAREIQVAPAPRPTPWRGLDERGRPWTIRIVPRQKRWEVHIAHDSLVPHIWEFQTADQAFRAAEVRIADLRRQAEIFIRSPRTSRQ